MDGEMGLLEFIMFIHADHDQDSSEEGSSDSDADGGDVDDGGLRRC